MKRDLTGQRFGRLKVLQREETGKPGNWWKCRCDCGNIKIVQEQNLLQGKVKSCGCLRRENHVNRIEDLTGQRFGKLTVLRLAPEYKGGPALWECRCDCGNLKTVRASKLKSGETKSCGCLKKENFDLAGKRFGKLTVLKLISAPNAKVKLWECQCDCGNHITASTKQLLNGEVTSCGCTPSASQSKDSEQPDLTGQRFGMLTVLGKADCEKKGTWWNCQCDCGNTRIASTDELISGKVISCGCVQRPKKDLSGKRFGALTVLHRVQTGKKGVWWKCKCDCGKERIVSTRDLTSGRVVNCGDEKNHPAQDATPKLRDDLTGRRFGRLTVIGLADTKLSGQYAWRCRCDCGNEIIVRGSTLRSGRTKSCGCLRSTTESRMSRVIDLTGQRFGQLTVLRMAENMHGYANVIAGTL